MLSGRADCHVGTDGRGDMRRHPPVRLYRVRRALLLGLVFGVGALGLFVARGPAATAHDAAGIRSSFVGRVTWRPAIQTAEGRIRVTNLRRPRLGSDGIGCRVVVHTRREQDITGGRAIAYWDAIGRVPRGTSRILGFQVHWQYGKVADHIHLRHCHTPWELNP